MRRTHGQYRTPTYVSWCDMLQRCQNTKHRWYQAYGGRGVKVYPPWLKFENFLAYMGFCPPGKILDRYPDNDGNYEPGNCRWATRKESQNNTRLSRFLELDGVRLTISQWAEKTGLPRAVIYDRVDRLHWSLKDALTITNHGRPKRGAVFTLNEETMTLKQWSERSGIHKDTLRSRFEAHGQNAEKILRKEHGNRNIQHPANELS